MLKFYYSLAPNPMKVALFLEEAGLPFDAIPVDTRKGEQHAPAFLALNPNAKVPVLVDGEMVLTQSGVIQDYVSSKTGKLGGRSAAERREILRWVFFDNHKVSGAAGTLRFNVNFLPEAKRNADVNAFLLMRFVSALKVLEAALTARTWLAGADVTIADLACCGYLYYPEPYGFDRAAFPAIDAWLTRISALPGWKHPYDLMPGSPADRA